MEVWGYAAMAAALAAGGLVKGATGMGLPLVALPALTAVFGLPHALSLLVVPILVTNFWQVWQHRGGSGDARLAFLPWLLLGGGIGVVVGTWLLVTLPERQLLFALGMLLLAYLALRLARPAWTIDVATARRAAFPIGVGAGALQGATGISAPLSVTFIHAMQLGQATHVYAVSAIFLLFAVVQLPALMLSGVMRVEWLAQGLVALVPILLAMPVGQWLSRQISAALFDRLILAFLGLIGLKLILGL